MNIDIWVFGTSNQLFIRGSKLKQVSQKIKVITGKTPFVSICPICTPHSICIDIGFGQGSFILKSCVLNLRTFN